VRTGGAGGPAVVAGRIPRLTAERSTGDPRGVGTTVPPQDPARGPGTGPGRLPSARVPRLRPNDKVAYGLWVPTEQGTHRPSGAAVAAAP
jgi:hypothetical protein